jgi:hypothetical protein
VSDLPDIVRGPGSEPERRLTPDQFEAVIRRAAELQAKGMEEPDRDGISQAELIRIGKEIGISPQHVRRALAETIDAPAAAPSLPDKVFGPDSASASRAVPGEPDTVRAQVEQYLVEREWLAVVRRFPGYTTYQKAQGVELAKLVSFAQAAFRVDDQPHVGAGFKLRNAKRVELSVQPLEEGYSYVSLRVDLGNYRNILALASTVGGWSLGATFGAILAIAVAPPAALLAIPIGGGAMWGARAAQGHITEHAQTHLESILDCLERGEPLIKPKKPRA